MPLTFVGNHDVTRLASRLDDDRHLPHALVILVTCAGTPSIYAGDEQAFRGIKEDRAGGDDAIRPAFPASPADLAPDGWPVYRLHQRLIGLRPRHPWLHAARTRIVQLEKEHIAYETGDGERRLMVALNLADRPAAQTLPRACRVLDGVAMLRRAGAADAQVELPPHGWGILAVEGDAGGFR